MTNDTLDLLAQLREEQARRYHLPHWAPRMISERLGIKPVTIRAWQDRGHLKLDGDAARSGHRHRVYSDHDALTIAAANTLAQLGISIPEAAEAVADIEKDLDHRMGVFASAATPAMVFIHHNGKTYVASRRPPESIAYITFDLDRLINETYQALGVKVTRGTAEDFRRAAAEMEKAEKAAQAPKSRRAE
jgi:DNA-binding transcriptional MerR regulator